jgi:hypothetical protein
MLRGPIDFVVIAFDGSNFDGSVLKELNAVVDAGIISIVALSVISKDKNGVFTQLDVENSKNESVVSFARKYNTTSDPLSTEDIDEVSDLLVNDSTAAVLVIEHLWAKPLKQALLNKKGYLVAEGRIHPEAAAELEKGGK